MRQLAEFGAWGEISGVRAKMDRRKYNLLYTRRTIHKLRVTQIENRFQVLTQGGFVLDL